MGDGWARPDATLVLPHRPPLEDRNLPHQIRLTVTSGHNLALGCNCASAPIAVRSCWAASEQRRVYADWHKEQGIEV
jgi:hypothetical protein